MSDLSDAPIYVDWSLAVMLLLAATIQYMWLSFHGHTIGRWLQALGFTGLGLRLVWTLSQGGDPQIAAVSIPLLAAIAGGASITAIHQMRLLWLDVRCLQKPDHACYREDRVRAALMERRK